ncbi:hypothetical protein HHI36_013786 [Cryptolaemus montrouzieri]|uniref:Tudor domain-containing protein n=1 Tax=Cryptolaemus montrouzieri TaxID=559131 RepID=A0ABD2NID5_9CUCU
MDESSEYEADLPNFFDKNSWKVDEIYRVSIENIYDPSKFWIRFAPVDVFQKHLWDFYNTEGESLSLKLSEISVGMNCVALISNLYYRGKIVRTNIQDNRMFQIFLYDFGMVTKVGLSQLYHLDKRYYEIPAFAVRAMLANINTLDHEMWDQRAVNRFQELTSGKTLIAQIAHVHGKRKILEIDLLDTSLQQKGKIPTINYRLVCEGFAKIAWHPPIKKNGNSPFKPLKKYLYLYPSFEMIENGLTPSQEYMTEQLAYSIPWDVLFPNFYQYQGTTEFLKSLLNIVEFV